ncbi:HNH endonuclease signature motif containing protein [Kineococcus sp. GCM10028916]|uniref:HNH endonuclease signature motif containing protein n=1 Tax=Kineococcus sp. GCM10028916 TaxID=3273394 RepID=UPI00363D4ABC
MTAALAERTEEAPTGVAFGLPGKYRRFADAAHAMFYLGVADAVTMVHHSPHPDLDQLDDRGITITGTGFDRWEAAVDLVAEEYSRDEGMDFDRATIHNAWRKGHDHRTLWQAVADATVTRYQARTIEDHAERLSARTATLTEEIDPDGCVTSVHAEEGEKLLQGDAYTAALQDYLTEVVHHAQAGLTGRKLGIKCSRKVRALTPGYESVVLEKNDDPRGIGHTPCEDGLNSHLGFIAPTAFALRLMAHTNAAADHAADAAKRAGLLDTRSHGQRVRDVIVDMLTDAMDRAVPALSDPTAPATADSPAVIGRTHRHATSVQVHVRIDATTLLGLDDDEATIDGLGPVPAHVARELATTTGAMWRKVICSPGTRDVIDVGAKAYAITDAMRRFITARDEYCTAPGCHVPAVNCDLDHEIPWPQGQTTASNLRAYCRGHHRFKTQYVFEATKAQQARIASRIGKPTELWPNLPDHPPF